MIAIKLSDYDLHTSLLDYIIKDIDWEYFNTKKIQIRCYNEIFREIFDERLIQHYLYKPKH